MYFKYCKSSEFLLGIQSYSLTEKEQLIKRKHSYHKVNKKYDIENEYNLVASKFEKIKELNHPNICRYLHICRNKNNYIICSEYYSLSLYDLLKEENINSYTNFKCLNKLSKKNYRNFENTTYNKIVDSKILNKIIYEILSAIQYLHKNKIKFLNLSTNNILITPKGKVKLHSYCISYLFNNHKYYNEKNNFFMNKLINEIMNSKKYKNKLITYHLKGYSEDSVKKGTLFNINKNKNNMKDNSLYIENYFNYYAFTDDLLYYLPFFIFLNLLKNKEISLKYDVYRHMDIFSLGVIILQIVNGLLNFNFIIENFSYFINMKKINELIKVYKKKKKIKKNFGSDSLLYNKKERNKYITMKSGMKNNSERIIKNFPDCNTNNGNIKKAKQKNCRNWKSYEYNCKGNYYFNNNCNDKKNSKIYKIVQNLKRIIIEKKENNTIDFLKKKELIYKEGEEKKKHMFFIRSSFKKKGILNKIQNIFILMLFIKIYFIFVYNKKKKKKRRDLSMLNMNIYNTFEKLYKEKYKDINKINYTTINYKIVKYTIEHLIDYKINTRFIKIIENMYSEFFNINIVENSLRRIFLPEKNNERVFFLHFLHQCLLLNFSKINVDSLLSHYYFFYNDNIIKTNKYSSNSNNYDHILNNELRLSHEKNNVSHTTTTNNNNINSITTLNEKKYYKYNYYNPYIIDYIVNIKDHNELKNKYYINKKNIYYWYSLLYSTNYNEELMNCNFLMKPCNILKIPYLIYKRKQNYYNLSLFSFYKLNIINKYYDIYSVYEYLIKEKKKKKRIIKYKKEGIHICTQLKDHTHLSEKKININSFKLFKKKHNNIKQIMNNMMSQSSDTLKKNKNKNNKIKEKINDEKEVYKPLNNNNEISTLCNETHLSGNNIDKNEKIMNFNFFNISCNIKNSCILFKDDNINTVGIYLNEFYDVIKDAYLFLSKNKNVTCECFYKKTKFFIYQYNLYLKFQELLKQQPMNNLKLCEEIKNEFPLCLRNIMYLILLNYNYPVLMKKSLEKKEKIKALIHVLYKRKIVKMVSNKNIYSNVTNSMDKLLNIKKGTTSKDCINNVDIDDNRNNINGVIVDVPSDSVVDVDVDAGIGVGVNTDADKNKEYVNKIDMNKYVYKCIKNLKKKLKCNNDLVGSLKFQKKIYDLLLLIKFKLFIKNKYLKYLLIPIILLYYNDIYLAYKCVKQIIKSYLLKLYKDKYYFNEYFYIFNSLLNYYIPELSIFFFKNNINITNLIRSWVCSLFCNFFDLENIYLLIDKILTLPPSYIFFVCISIFLYLKKFLMKTSCKDFHKNIFSLSNIVDLNFILNISTELFNKSYKLYINFPSSIKINEVIIDNTLIKKHNNINYLFYLVQHKLWFNYYVHKHTFKIYKKIKRKKKENLINKDIYSINKELNIITNNVEENRELISKDSSIIDATFKNVKKKLKILKLKGNECIENKNIKNYKTILCNDKCVLKHKNKKSLKLKHYEYFLKFYKMNKKNNLNEFIYCNENKSKNSIQKKKNTYHIYHDSKNKKSFKSSDLIKLNCFPILPIFYTNNLLNEIFYDNLIIVDMRSPECFKKKRFKYSVHVNTFLINFKKGFYNNYIDDYNININLKTIVLIFNNYIFDFDSIYNFLNLKIKFLTILYGGFQHALHKLPANYFT